MKPFFPVHCPFSNTLDLPWCEYDQGLSHQLDLISHKTVHAADSVHILKHQGHIYIIVYRIQFQ